MAKHGGQRRDRAGAEGRELEGGGLEIPKNSSCKLRKKVLRHIQSQTLLIPVLHRHHDRTDQRALCFGFCMDSYLQKCCNGETSIPRID